MLYRLVEETGLEVFYYGDGYNSRWFLQKLASVDPLKSHSRLMCGLHCEERSQKLHCLRTPAEDTLSQLVHFADMSESSHVPHIRWASEKARLKATEQPMRL